MYGKYSAPSSVLFEQGYIDFSVSRFTAHLI